MVYFWVILFLYLVFYGTWLFYVAFMNIKEHQHKIKEKLGIIWYGLAPFFAIALVFDVIFNWTIGTLYYRELPREFLFTARCARHLKGSGTHLMRATRVCNILLNPFDEGHCL